jgi:hypothetical protein
MAELADAFSHAVHDFVQLLVLRLKKDVHGMKVLAFNIPMRLAGFGIENEFVGQQAGQLRCDGLTVFVGDANVGIHKLFLLPKVLNENARQCKLFAGAGEPNPCWPL